MSPQGLLLRPPIQQIFGNSLLPGTPMLKKLQIKTSFPYIPIRQLTISKYHYQMGILQKQ